MSDARGYGAQPGRIRAVLVVTCSLCQERAELPGKSVIKAGAFARELEWSVHYNDWTCPACTALIDNAVDAAWPEPPTATVARVRAELVGSR